MKILNILSVLGLLAAFPCNAQTTTTTPSGNGQAVERKLAQMSPEERREFLKNHPEIRERMREHFKRMIEKLEGMTPDQRKEFLQNHPRLKEFIHNHPKLAQRLG